jgi:nucleoside-diphosphate-sugar epimerase
VHAASLGEGRDVVGRRQYDAVLRPEAERARVAELEKSNHFRFIRHDLADRDGTASCFAEHEFPHVVHLAAQAGVRHSLKDPHAYVDANMQGFSTSWKAAGTMAASIWFTLHRRRSMAPTPSCRSARPTMSTIRSAFMPPARRPMS